MLRLHWWWLSCYLPGWRRCGSWRGITCHAHVIFPAYVSALPNRFNENGGEWINHYINQLTRKGMRSEWVGILIKQEQIDHQYQKKSVVTAELKTFDGNNMYDVIMYVDSKGKENSYKLTITNGRVPLTSMQCEFNHMPTTDTSPDIVRCVAQLALIRCCGNTRMQLHMFRLPPRWWTNKNSILLSNYSLPPIISVIRLRVVAIVSLISTYHDDEGGSRTWRFYSSNN